MQALTSSFSSSNRSPNSIRLHDTTLYYGPAPTKIRATIPIAADEWSDIDVTFAEASQHEVVASTELLDYASGFNIKNQGESCSPFLYSDFPSNTREIRH